MMDRKEGVINSTWKQGWGQERLEGRGDTHADSLCGLKVGDTEMRGKVLPDRGKQAGVTGRGQRTRRLMRSTNR